MNVTLMAILLIVIVVFTVVTDKVPLNFVLLLVPFIFSLLLGHSLLQTSDFVLQQFAALMQTTSFMLLFAFLYFTMLTESGMFNTIVAAVTNHLKMNVLVLIVLTTFIGGFSILTGNFTPAYLITFPILLPLFKKFNFDRGDAFMIAQATMTGVVNLG